MTSSIHTAENEDNTDSKAETRQERSSSDLTEAGHEGDGACSTR